MPGEKQSIPIRAARAMAVLWLCIFLVTIGLGVALAAVQKWRDRTASSEPTAQNTMRYIEHGRVYFAAPKVVRWHERLIDAFLALASCTVVISAVAGAMAWRTDAVGRRLPFR